MMGLAPYGQPVYEDLILKHLVKLNEDGSININQDYFSYLDGKVMTNTLILKIFLQLFLQTFQ